MEYYLRHTRGNASAAYGQRRPEAADLMANTERRGFVVFLRAGHHIPNNRVYRDALQTNGVRYKGMSAAGGGKARLGPRLIAVATEVFISFAQVAVTLDEVPSVLREAVLRYYPASMAFPMLGAPAPLADAVLRRYTWLSRTVVIDRYAAYAETSRAMARDCAGAQCAAMKAIVEQGALDAMRVPPLLVMDVSRIAISHRRASALMEARAAVADADVLYDALFLAGVDSDYFLESNARVPRGYFASEGRAEQSPPSEEEEDEGGLALCDLSEGGPAVARMLAIMDAEASPLLVEEEAEARSEQPPSADDSDAASLQIFSDVRAAHQRRSPASLFMPSAAACVDLGAECLETPEGMRFRRSPRAPPSEEAAADAYCLSAAVFAVLEAFVGSGAVRLSDCTLHGSLLSIYRAVAEGTRAFCPCRLCWVHAELDALIRRGAAPSAGGPLLAAAGCTSATPRTLTVARALAEAVDFFSDIEVALAEQLLESAPWRFAHFAVLPVKRVDIPTGPGGRYRTELHFSRAPAATADASLLSTATVINDLFAGERTEPLAVADLFRGVLHLADSRVCDVLQVGFVPTCPGRNQNLAHTSTHGVYTSRYACEYVYDHAEMAEQAPCLLRGDRVHTARDLARVHFTMEDAAKRPALLRPVRRFRIRAALSWPLMVRTLLEPAGLSSAVYFVLRWLSAQLFTNKVPANSSAPGVLLASSRHISSIPGILNEICRVVTLGDRRRVYSELVADFREVVTRVEGSEKAQIALEKEGAYATARPGRVGSRTLACALWACIHCASSVCMVSAAVMRSVAHCLVSAPALAQTRHCALRALCEDVLRVADSGQHAVRRALDGGHYFAIRSGPDVLVPLLFFRFAADHVCTGMALADARAVMLGVDVGSSRRAFRGDRGATLTPAWNAQQGARDTSARTVWDTLREGGALLGDPPACADANADAPLLFLQEAMMFSEVLSRHSPRMERGDLAANRTSFLSCSQFRGLLPEKDARRLASADAGNSWARRPSLGPEGVPAAWRPLAEWGAVRAPDLAATEDLGHRQVFPVWQPHMNGVSVQGRAGEALTVTRGFMPFAGSHPFLLQCVLGVPLLLDEGASYDGCARRLVELGRGEEVALTHAHPVEQGEALPCKRAAAQAQAQKRPRRRRATVVEAARLPP